MSPLPRYIALLLFSATAAFPHPFVSAADIADALNRVTLDPNQTFRVRDLHLRRGGVAIYLTEGVLSFATEVNGRRFAALFTTSGVEAGDAEILLLPPQAAERHSLASFAKTPNLDEHFNSAFLYFTDETANELLAQIQIARSAKAAEIDAQLRAGAERILQGTSAQIKTRMVSAILDPGPTQNGFFYAAFRGRDLRDFDLLYDPNTSEPVTVGRVVADKIAADAGTNQSSHFELWTNYRPRNLPPYQTPKSVISGYSIDATVQPDLTISAIARFVLAAHADPGRVVSLNLSRRMRVESATVDSAPVEIFQQADQVSNGFNSDAEFLLVLKQELDASRGHRIEIRYSGSIISQVSGSYLVNERNLWYPHTETMLTDFDLRFHCPERFEIVSTGGLVDERVENGVRTVHRRTESPQQMAGFNLGEYREQSIESAPYQIQSYEEKALEGNFNGIPEQAAEILQHYTAEWLKLSDGTLAITPVPGDFGQGFPGLIYLSRTAYLPEAVRPRARRTEQDRSFFSNLLLPHEIAHQWWGNMVTPEGYRSEWLMEAMANASALEFIARTGGAAIANSILEQYREDLQQVVDGKTMESSGPLDFGTRIMTTAGFSAWQTVVYKKGTWILQMLRSRIGDANFIKMQADLLRTYAGQPIGNDDLRRVASRYVPANQPDKDLELFFEAWIYGTGIPKISLNHSGTKLKVDGVDAAFSADLPLTCKSRAGGPEQVRWLRIEAGENATPAAGCKLPSRLDYLYFPE